MAAQQEVSLFLLILFLFKI